MALEQVFECPSTLKNLRSDPLGAILDGFCEWLLQRRFSRPKIRMHLSSLFHLNEHLGSPKAPMRQSVTAGDLAGFLEAYPSRCGHRGPLEEHLRRVRYSVKGKRDYAILLLACRLGLRAGDMDVGFGSEKGGLDDYVLKSPAHLVRLRAAVRVVLEHAQTRRHAMDLESRLDLLLRRLNVGVFRCGPDGTLLSANGPILALLGVDSLNTAALIGLDRVFVGREHCRTLVQHAIESGEPREGECELGDADGKPTYFRLSVVPVKMSDGATVIDGLLEDITELKRSEAEARQAAIAAARTALLTAREREVLDAVVAGKANKVIARRSERCQPVPRNGVRRFRLKNLRERSACSDGD